MSDIRYLQQKDGLPYSVSLDFFLTDVNLTDDTLALQSAVIVALGTDARANPDDVLPDPDSTDRRGWWGDLEAEEIWGGWPVGSKLWLLSRTKIMGRASREGDTLERAVGYTVEALQPFVGAQIATRVDAAAQKRGIDGIEVAAMVTRGAKENIILRYAQLWDELGRV